MFINSKIPWVLWPVLTNFSGQCSRNEFYVSVVYEIVNTEEVEGAYSISTFRSASEQ